MKKFLILCSLVIWNLGANAQETDAEQTNVTNVVQNQYKPYSRLYVGYSPVFFSQNSYHSAGTETEHGGIVGWTYGISLTKKCPLYLEFGFVMSLNWERESDEFWFDNDKGKNVKAAEIGSKYTLLRLAIPFNLTYRFSVSNNFVIAPYVGFTCCFNPINDASLYVEYTDDYKKTDEYKIISSYYPEFEYKTYYHHEIQASCQVGFNMTIAKHFSLGAEYGLDLTNIADDTKSSRAAVKFGYEW